MNGRGDYHRFVPTDPGENLLFRRALLELCLESGEARRLAMRACRDDFAFFVNAFCWQINPRKLGDEVGPFVLYPFQLDAALKTIENLAAGRGILWTKSRYQGATWVVLLIQTWVCLFFEWKNFIDVSHTADAVDKKNDPNSLFYKIDFIHKRLPGWMSRDAKHPRKMQIEYPATNAFVSGYASSQRAGVGGRATGIFSDEHGLQEDGEAIRKNMALVGPQIIVSAHYGQVGDFFNLVTYGDGDRVELHWTKNPACNRGMYRFDPTTNSVVLLDDHKFPPDYPFVRQFEPTGGPAPGVRSPWYDAMCRELGSRQAAACQLDMDPTGASNLVFDPVKLADHMRNFCRDPDHRGHFLFEEGTAKPLGFRADADGPFKLWLHLDRERPPGLPYFIGADVAGGTGGSMSSPSVASVADVFGRKVAEFASPKIEPRPFGYMLVALARFFADADGTPAKLVWEIPGPGQIVSKVVLEVGFLNVYRQPKNAGVANIYSSEETDRIGWTNQPASKRLAMTNYAGALANGQYQNPSRQAVEECRRVEWGTAQTVTHAKDRSAANPGEAGVNHSDRVIADMLTWMILEPFRRFRERSAAAEPVDYYGSNQGLQLYMEYLKGRERTGNWVKR